MESVRGRQLAVCFGTRAMEHKIPTGHSSSDLGRFISVGLEIQDLVMLLCMLVDPILYKRKVSFPLPCAGCQGWMIYPSPQLDGDLKEMCQQALYILYCTYLSRLA